MYCILVIINKNMQDKNTSSYIPAAIILAGFLIAGGIYLSERGNAPTVNPDTSKQPESVLNPISSADYVLGNPDAPITVVEFSDTECPFCKMFQNTMQSVMDIYGKDGKVAWVYRHFPLDQLHSKSRKEAEAVECVGDLGGSDAFWKMLNTIYTNTPANDGLDPAKLPVFAKESGVDVTKFNACLSSGKNASVVETDLRDGIKVGVHGTPYSILVLKNTLSASAENSLNEYIIKSSLAQNVTISSDNKEVSLNGALPLEMMKSMLDIILK